MDHSPLCQFQYGLRDLAPSDYWRSGACQQPDKEGTSHGDEVGSVLAELAPSTASAAVRSAQQHCYRVASLAVKTGKITVSAAASALDAASVRGCALRCLTVRLIVQVSMRDITGWMQPGGQLDIRQHEFAPVKMCMPFGDQHPGCTPGRVGTEAELGLAAMYLYPQSWQSTAQQWPAVDFKPGAGDGDSIAPEG